MYKSILNNLAYQRYALSCLHNSLSDEQRCLSRGDFTRVEDIDGVIALLTSGINEARAKLEKMLSDRSVPEYVDGLEEKAAARLRAILADMAYRGHGCTEELKRIRAIETNFHFTSLPWGNNSVKKSSPTAN